MMTESESVIGDRQLTPAPNREDTPEARCARCGRELAYFIHFDQFGNQKFPTYEDVSGFTHHAFVPTPKSERGEVRGT
jgi:hypothetical protein